MERNISWGMRCQLWCRRTWLAFSLRGLSNVDGAEPLARYVSVKRWLDGKTRRAKPNAFMPRADRRLSVYRTGTMSESLIWRLGSTVAATSHERRAHAVTGVRGADVPDVGLELKRSYVPLLHRDVMKWPEKSEQKLFAEKLAALAITAIAPE